MPQIQEPDDRFWTPLRAVFTALCIAGAIYLALSGLVAQPAAPPLPTALPPLETELP